MRQGTSIPKTEPIFRSLSANVAKSLSPRITQQCRSRFGCHCIEPEEKGDGPLVSSVGKYHPLPRPFYLTVVPCGKSCFIAVSFHDFSEMKVLYFLFGTPLLCQLAACQNVSSTPSAEDFVARREPASTMAHPRVSSPHL